LANDSFSLREKNVAVLETSKQLKKDDHKKGREMFEGNL